LATFSALKNSNLFLDWNGAFSSYLINYD
jgi:hypothetical protein